MNRSRRKILPAGSVMLVMNAASNGESGIAKWATTPSAVPAPRPISIRTDSSCRIAAEYDRSRFWDLLEFDGLTAALFPLCLA